MACTLLRSMRFCSRQVSVLLPPLRERQTLLAGSHILTLVHCWAYHAQLVCHLRTRGVRPKAHMQCPQTAAGIPCMCAAQCARYASNDS